MNFNRVSAFLNNDRMNFLELTQAEFDLWMGVLFERIGPTMAALSALLFGDNQPVNLTVILDLTTDEVRGVAREMAAALLTRDRLAGMLPQINAYCDDLLSRGCLREAAFVQNGLIRAQNGDLPSQNPLLIEICVQSLYQQVEIISQVGQTGQRRAIKQTTRLH